MPRLKTLVIPHVPLREGIRLRSWEMARFLAEDERFDVSFLCWQPAADAHGPIDKLITRLREARVHMRSPDREQREGRIRCLSGPFLLWPRVSARRFNRRQLHALIEREGFDRVISANETHFPVPKGANSRFRYVHDVVDDHISPGAQANWRALRRFVRAELPKADLVSVISRSLEALVGELGARRVLRVPNGVDLSASRAVRPEPVRQLRAQYGLDGRFSLSFIGNHHMAVSGLEFLLEVFQGLRSRRPDATLLVIGPIADLEGRRARWGADSGVIFTGAIAPAEIAPYFAIADLGVLPFELTPFTHHALPLKLLEYGAARKQVVAVPLRELALLKLPHVHLVERGVEPWLDALADNARALPPWQAAWNEIIDGYDWRVIVQGFADVLAGL